jgi:hypothetical protein
MVIKKIKTALCGGDLLSEILHIVVAIICPDNPILSFYIPLVKVWWT